jgi:hypothetical protein
MTQLYFLRTFDHQQLNVEVVVDDPSASQTPSVSLHRIDSKLNMCPPPAKKNSGGYAGLKLPYLPGRDSFE